jgi:hypothetical protein
MPETNKTRRVRTRHATLDQRFYAELLHIAGLCETVTGGKPAIARCPEQARVPGSLVENALARIEARDGPQARVNPQRERFETVLRLCIAWLSRLVFLKLLETRLLALHNGDPAYAFLRSARIRSFAELDALCGEVLVNEPPASPAQFPLIPRFEGSVFVSEDLQDSGIPLGALADSPMLPVFAQTALMQAREALNPVCYLLDFLDAYDFSPRATQPGNAGKPKVDTATLGLIFEKFNGYREGAWFTPGSVATYLAGVAIESATIRRFNRLKGWHCESIDQLCQAIVNHDEAREIVDALRVCDPAAGSGHLLVSALNARVALKSRLGLVTDAAGRPLDGYCFEIESDRLTVKRKDGTSLDSTLAEEERQRLDAALFREKCGIVEHSLFGVDINPDAVRMTKLRLWIELLEHAGYDANGQFAALPNLDIPIRQGNAAIQRFGFLSPLEPDLEPKSPYESSATSSLYDNAFEWRTAFPHVLDDTGAFPGFDAIVANPPYIDSERMANEGMLAVREHLARRWPAARGNWDLYIVFMELGLSLLAPTGAMACLTPDKWLAKPFGDAFRARYLDKIERIAALGRGVFDRARVDSIVTLYANEGTGFVSTARLEEGVPIPLAHARKSALAAPWRLDALLSPHHAFVQKMARSHTTLGSLLRCENACATSDAYRLKPLVEEANGRFDPLRQFRVVNTGTLGQFVSRWGIRPMTYLGDRYHAPVVDRARFAAEFANAYGTKARAKKVIVKGLTRLDAALDLAGDTIPGKTTLILRSNDDSLLKFAAAVLNCPLSAFYLRARYPSASYNGGTAFTKAMIDSVPVPREPEVRSAVVGLVDALLAYQRAGLAAEAAAVSREIDCLLYEAFGLSAEEMAQIAGNDRTQGVAEAERSNEKGVTADVL